MCMKKRSKVSLNDSINKNKHETIMHGNVIVKEDI
jgi:hypothetical protein